MALPPTWGTGEYFIPLRLLLLARMVERETARDLQVGFNLSVADWRVLALTCTIGAPSAAEIRSVFETDRAEVSRAVARLLKANLVQREPDSRHRQKMRIIPTDAGRDIFEGVRAMREAYFASILQDLTVEERGNFEAALKSIALRVDELRSGKSVSRGPDGPTTERLNRGVQALRGSEGLHGEADPAAEGDHGDPDHK